MKRLPAARFLAAVLSCLVWRISTAAAEDVYVKNFDDWQVSIEAYAGSNGEVTGAGQWSDYRDWVDDRFRFVGKGSISIRIKATYLGTEVGDHYLLPSDPVAGGQSDFSFRFEDPTTLVKDFNVVNGAGEWGIIVRLNLWVDVGGQPKDGVSAVVDTAILHQRHIYSAGGTHGANGTIAVSEPRFDDQGRNVGRAVIGEPLSFEVVSPDDGSVILEQNDAATFQDGNYARGIARFELLANPSTFLPGEVKNVTVRATDSAGNQGSAQQQLHFAYVMTYSAQGANLVSNVTDTDVPFTEENKKLVIGSRIRLKLQAGPGFIYRPWVRLRFCDGAIGQLELNDWDANRSNETIVTIGENGPDYNRVRWTVSLEREILKAKSNPAAFVLESIWDYGVSKGIDWAIPGTSYVVKQSLEKVFGLTVKPEFRNWNSGRGSPGAQGLMEPSATAWLNGSVHEEGPGSALTGLDIESLNKQAADHFAAVMRNGDLQVDNANGERIVTVTDDRGVQAAAGAFSRVIYSTLQGDFDSSGVSRVDGYSLGAPLIDPPDGSQLQTRIPLITISFSEDIPIKLETLAVRVNGVLQKNYVRRNNKQAVFQVSRERPLRFGRNELDVILPEGTGKWMQGQAIYDVRAAAEPPSRLTSVEGGNYIILRWAKNSEPDVIGYHLYSGQTPEGISTKLTTAPVPEPVFAAARTAFPELADGRYIAVSAAGEGWESALSTPIFTGFASTTAVQVPGPPAALQLEARDGAVAVSFPVVDYAYAYLLERDSGGGFSQTPGGGLITAQGYNDRSVEKNRQYRYRLTTYGRNMTAGGSRVSNWISPADEIPPPPVGLTFRRRYYGENYLLRWDPAENADHAGYFIYTSKNGGTYTKLSPNVYTPNEFITTSLPTGLWGYRITAVDTSGNESEPSDVIYASRTCPLLPRTVTPPIYDEDGDGVADLQEEADGSDSSNPASKREHLRSPVFSVWTGFLDITPIAEVFNPSDQPAFVELALMHSDGTAGGVVEFEISSGGQRDIILSDMPGFRRDAYGLVRLEFCGGPIDGRVSYYRTAAGGQSYDFAYSIPFTPPLYGGSAVSFNTFQPSFNAADAGNTVANWLTIVNLDSWTRHFSIHRYSGEGEFIGTKRASIEPGGRADVEAGHENPGPYAVGLLGIVPDTPGGPYLATSSRFGYNSSGGFDFAFPLRAQAGNSRPLVAALTTTVNAQNWLEIANSSTEAGSIAIEFFRSDGLFVRGINDYLPPLAQHHYNVNELLGSNQLGFAIIDAQDRAAVVAQSMVYIRDSFSGSIKAMYGSGAREPLGSRLVGSYNLFLGMYNWLKLINPGSEPASAVLRVQSGAPTERTITLPPRSSVDLGLHEAARYQTAPNTYGSFKLELLGDTRLYSEMLRLRPEPGTGAVDFIFPTEVRDAR